jgi:hypothetical protein
MGMPGWTEAWPLTGGRRRQSQGVRIDPEGHPRCLGPGFRALALDRRNGPAADRAIDGFDELLRGLVPRSRVLGQEPLQDHFNVDGNLHAAPLGDRRRGLGDVLAHEEHDAVRLEQRHARDHFEQHDSE